MSNPESITLILAPAGPTEWDAADRLQGSVDLPMAAEWPEFSAVVEGVSSAGPGAVLSAPDESSLAVARAVASRVGVKARVVPALAEPSLGLWEGLDRKAWRERYNKAAKQWRTDPAGVHPPEGEPFADAAGRILTGAAKAIDKAGKPVVAIVARPMTLAAIRRFAAGAPVLSDWLDPPARGIETVVIEADALRAEPVLHTPAGVSP